MMRFTRIYTLMFLAGLLSFSSCEEEEEAGVANGKMVSLEFPIEISGMKQVGDETPDTRAAATAAEKEVKKLYVVQFNGKDATSKAVVKTEVSRDAGNKVTFAKLSAVNATCRVYMVANVDPGVTVNTTTLADFEKSLALFSPTQAIPTTGLPMCGSDDFNPTTVSTAPRITLTAMVAKLVVRYNLSNSALFKSETTPKLALKNAATGTTYNTSAASDKGSLMVDNLALNTTYTFYVAENRAGTNTDATAWNKRTLARIPAGSAPLYFEITGKDADNGSVSIVSLIGDPNKPTEFNINRNTCYTLTATINGFKSDERITVTPEYFNLNVGNKSANCYIVLGNEAGVGTKEYGFTYTVRGNDATSVAGINYSTLPNLSTVAEARVLWQTGGTTSVIQSVKLDKDNGKVIFTIGSATEGNAVIGVFASNAANAPCLWSWHIWRLNGTAPGTVNCTKTIAPTSFKMMDRNLGAYNNTEGNVGSIGLLYQWGRKDPFPGPAGFNTTEPSNIYGSFNKGGTTGSWNGTYSIQAVTTAAGTGTELYAVNYPTAYILGTSANGSYDWYWGSRNDNLWGTPWTSASNSYNVNQGTKSIYDPCPIGYRVPPHDTWSKQTGNGTFRSNGIVLGSVAANFWFPAAGYRDGSNGGLYSASSNGRYWSSSPNGSGSVSGGYLYFGNNGGVDPRDYGDRAYGYSVRCVSE